VIWSDFQEAAIIVFGPAVMQVASASFAIAIIIAAYEIVIPVFRRLVMKS
jgi:hypothetical protein